MILEQHATESELAAELLWHAAPRLQGRKVLDLGAGTGILAIGAALLGAAEVIAVEKDEAAARLLRENLETYEGTEQVRVVVEDIERFTEEGDLVIMNPPFGTKRRHADRVFLEKAFHLAPLVYSIHKTSTAGFIHAFIHDKKCRITLELQKEFPLLRSMPHPHHTKKTRNDLRDTLLFRALGERGREPDNNEVHGEIHEYEHDVANVKVLQEESDYPSD